MLCSSFEDLLEVNRIFEENIMERRRMIVTYNHRKSLSKAFPEIVKCIFLTGHSSFWLVLERCIQYKTQMPYFSVWED